MADEQPGRPSTMTLNWNHIHYDVKLGKVLQDPKLERHA